MRKKPKAEILAIPNLFSLSRIFLTPVFLWMMSRGKPWEAFAVFSVAGATDALDGFAARLLNLKTKTGLWLDPVGDKILLTATFIALTIPSWSFPNTLPFWLTAICIGRDVLIATGAAVILSARGPSTFPPTLLGKISTICQVTLLFVVLLFNGLIYSPSWLYWAYLLTAAITGLSGIQYVSIGFRMMGWIDKPNS